MNTIQRNGGEEFPGAKAPRKLQVFDGGKTSSTKLTFFYSFMAFAK